MDIDICFKITQNRIFEILRPFMNSSYRLKQDVLRFLSNQEFKKCEFKDIRNGFVQVYPEFSAKKYYAKIYQIIRELEKNNLFIIDRNRCIYKYSSIENQNLYLEIVGSSIEEETVKQQLLLDFHRVNSRVHRIDAEIEVFDKYINLYPKIKDRISKLMAERKQVKLKLQSELSAIEIIMNNI